MNEELKKALEHAESLKKKKEVEKYLNDKAWEIGEYLANQGKPLDVFISIEEDGKEYAEGSYLVT